MALITDITKCYGFKPGNMETDKRNWLNCLDQVGEHPLDQVQHGENPNIGLYQTTIEKLSHSKEELSALRSKIQEKQMPSKIQLSEETINKIKKIIYEVQETGVPVDNVVEEKAYLNQPDLNKMKMNHLYKKSTTDHPKAAEYLNTAMNISNNRHGMLLNHQAIRGEGSGVY